MPDANKFAKLREIGYTIRVTCGICQHGCFKGMAEWGTCDLHQYEHLKHTGPARGVSVVRYGSCPQGVLSTSKADLGAHREFLESK